MKRNILLFTTVLCGALVSCQVKETDTLTPESPDFVFYASHGDVASSKTVLQQDGSILWGPGDAIQVFCGRQGSAKFVSSNEENAAEVEFHGSLEGIPYVPDDEFWAVYPYHEGDTYGGEYVTVTLPAEQTAAEGTFDKDLFISIARSSDNHLQFYNVCGGIKFSLAQSGVTRVIFQGNNYEELAGEARVSFDINGRPSITKIDHGVSRITLTPPGGGYFKPGKDYYVVAFPAVLEEGYTLYIQTETQRGVRTSSQPVAVKRAVWGELEQMDKTASFHDAIPENQIWYTTSNGAVLNRSEGWSGYFGEAQLVSNTYEDGQGIMTFDRPLTVIGSDAFNRYSITNNTLTTSFRLPDTIREIGDGAFREQYNLASIELPHELISIGEYAFYRCSGLLQINLPPLVEEIGKGSFEETKSLAAIKLPSKIKTIPGNAFCQSGISKVEFPDGLESIGFQAFGSCKNLSGLTFPEGLTIIGEYAFSHCESIDKEIVLPNSLLRLENSAFASTSLQAIHFPDNLEHLGEGVFSESGIKKLTLPPKLEKVPEHLCSQCESLESVTLHQDVKDIGLGAFSGCGRLKEIALPEGLELIAGEAFSSTGLMQVVIPNTVTYIGGHAFYNCEKLETISLSSEIESLEEGVLMNCKMLSSIVIPDKVVTVNKNAFYGCTSLSDVRIGSGVVVLGASAFANCTKLASITIPDNVEKLQSECFAFAGIEEIILHKGLKFESRLFHGCENLHSVTLPEDLVELPSGCFMSCSSLKELTLPENLTTISGQAFWECKSLESLDIPNSVTSIDSHVFYNCISLKQMIIPEGVEQVPISLFDGCVRLQAVDLPSSIKRIGSCAFRNCKSLETVSMKKGSWLIDETMNIESSAFNGCLSLTSITFPQEIQDIGESAFANCPRLASVLFQGKVGTIQRSAFKSCSALESIELPNTVTYIGPYAFSESGLRNMTLPPKVNTVSENLFSGCQQLEHVVVPADVTKIERQAFVNCIGLQDITLYPATPPSLETSAFANTNNCALLVPGASVEAYKGADKWSDYASRVQAMTE